MINIIRENKMTTLVSIAACLLIIVATVIVGLPTESSASTYGYVNTSDNVVYVTADSPAGAFANSTNIAETSGVILVSNTPASSNTGQVLGAQSSGYMYVNDFGVVTHVFASSPGGAFASSVNIDPNSGVMLIDSIADSNMIGDQQ